MELYYSMLWTMGGKMAESPLARFVQAQESSYATALQELKQGKKTSHWIWYIFPQIIGLGYSETAKFYAIKDLKEAKQYLAHPILGPRLEACSQAMLAHSSLTALDIMGYPDNLKLQSSMTLFDVAEPYSEFRRVLRRFYNGEKDQVTLENLSI